MSFLSSVSSNKCAVRLMPSEDGCFLLDIENDRILKLNTIGAEMWSLLSAGEVESQIVQKISCKYRVDEQRVAADVSALLAKIAAFHLSPTNSITGTDQSSLAPPRQKQPYYPWYGQTAGDTHRPEPRAAVVLTALFGLAIFDLVLWLSSVKSVCACVKACPIRKRRSRDVDAIGRICSAVEEACVWYPKRTLCLQRSAVTTCLLRACGLAARMVVGIRSMPFMAHEWVEVENAVVNDWPGVRKFYCPLASH